MTVLQIHKIWKMWPSWGLKYSPQALPILPGSRHDDTVTPNPLLPYISFTTAALPASVAQTHLHPEFLRDHLDRDQQLCCPRCCRRGASFPSAVLITALVCVTRREAQH